ncbi:MAG: hypothetical protein FRX48_06058 [Lasallia pustulata]|uniref:Uncharacterized protein n=1 Tax=Lasallia pustulata TaxID=136370 RepID=A0A5M8PMB3_9LECA|nr:MAG: hypothetical protein FRX48_06058 [Lasallia pustulata]
MKMITLSTLWFTLAIAHLISVGSATPALRNVKSSLLPRSQFCANAPATIAGTTLDRRDSSRSNLPVLPSLADLLGDNAYPPIIWCARGTKTYILLTLVRPLNSGIVLSLLDDARSTILGHIAIWGDGVVEDGFFNWAGAGGLKLRMVNSNNHQLTWGVVGAAIEALGEYMHQAVTGPGEGWFSILDGTNEVGTGTILSK